MNENIVVIVQARLGSTRLPAKILKSLNGYPVLEHVLERCGKILGREQVVCAGVDDPSEIAVRDLVEGLGFEFFAGDERDVLARYYYAAKSRDADWVVRVTSDCPLLDPKVCRGLIEKVVVEHADYGATGSWPHGLDCEITRFSALKQAHFSACLPVDREHVTLWIRSAVDVFKKLVFGPPYDIPNVGQYRWVVDYPDDYLFLQSLFSALDIRPDSYPETQIVIDYLQRHSGLLDINKHRIADWAKKNKAIIEQSQR